jgi:beta-glucosidase
MPSRQLRFPSDFLFGAATAAYQIEGAATEDGRGESIWDRFGRIPGNIANGDTGDIACDHYHRMKEDVKLMKLLGLKAYRFSIAWPRIMPDGKAPVNQKGVDFYKRLVEELLNAGIQPWATLFHWDLPQTLHERGGWSSRETAAAFAVYSEFMAAQLGDRVKNWMTINEPWVVASHGYKTGVHAPGIKNERTALQVAHGLLLAHGMSMQAIRAQRRDAKVGIALSLSPFEAETNAARDYIAAERKWQEEGQWLLHPLFRGVYPEALFHEYGNNAPKIAEGDMQLISQPMDFLGIQYYFRKVLGESGFVERMPDSEYTEMGWEVHPQSLRSLLARLADDYRNLPPLYITENGAAFADTVLPDGRINDKRRIAFLRDHLHQAYIAMEQGVNLKGYFAWSLLDNFQWACGYEKRFGLIHVDYATQHRRIKDSGLWYQAMIAAGGRFDVEEPEDFTPPPLDLEPANPTYALPMEFQVTLIQP